MALRKFQITSTDGVDVYIPYTTADMVATTPNRRFITDAQKQYINNLQNGMLDRFILHTVDGTKKFMITVENDGRISTLEII